MKKKYESVFMTIIKHTEKDVLSASPTDGIGVPWSDNWVIGDEIL